MTVWMCGWWSDGFSRGMQQEGALHFAARPLLLVYVRRAAAPTHQVQIRGAAAGLIMGWDGRDGGGRGTGRESRLDCACGW